LLDYPPERPKEHTHVKAIPPTEEEVNDKVEAIIGWVKRCHAVEKARLEKKLKKEQEENARLQAIVKELEDQRETGAAGQLARLKEKLGSLINE